MSFNKKFSFSSKEVVVNSLGQLSIKKRFLLKLVYKYYRFLTK